MGRSGKAAPHMPQKRSLGAFSPSPRLSNPHAAHASFLFMLLLLLRTSSSACIPFPFPFPRFSAEC
jgi:hypothetical protein